MTDVKLDPLEYLAPPTTSFWDWDVHAATLVSSNSGTTIAFRPELEHILRTMSQNGCGLPPLSFGRGRLSISAVLVSAISL